MSKAVAQRVYFGSCRMQSGETVSVHNLTIIELAKIKALCRSPNGVAKVVRARNWAPEATQLGKDARTALTIQQDLCVRLWENGTLKEAIDFKNCLD